MDKILFQTGPTQKNIERRDYILKKFSKYLELAKCEILEVGCGNGRFGILLAPSVAKYYGIDPDKDYIELARKTKPENAEYKIGRAENIPYEKQFDIVFYANSWHFVKDYEQAIKETKRVLKDNGILVILEPTEHTNTWAAKTLVKGDPAFNEELYKKKIARLNYAKKILEEQTIFKIVESEYYKNTTSNLWILKI